MNIKISVLVPVYKVEPYLRRCIDSVLRQDFQDWELILVDDGSPDNCPTICDEYAQRDKRIKVIHKQNGGANSSRLAAFKEAIGEYLVFLDADDWLLDSALSTLYQAITSEGGFDLVKCIVKRVSERGEEWIEHYQNEKGVLEGENIFFDAINNDSVAPYLHSGIYRRNLFSEKAFIFLENYKISVGDDWINNYYVALHVRRVKFIETPTYAYFLNTSSMMGGSVYGWEYYAKIEKCMAKVNADLGIKQTSDYTLESALHGLRFFFLPEVPFSWEHFKQIQPLVKEGLKKNKVDRNRVNPKYIRFVKHKVLFYLYTLLFRYAFLVLKLKGKKRKLLK